MAMLNSVTRGHLVASGSVAVVLLASDVWGVAQSQGLPSVPRAISAAEASRPTDSRPATPRAVSPDPCLTDSQSPQPMLAPWTVEGDSERAEFGTSVSVAGDVNGDGYSDIIVGAPFFSRQGLKAGRASVFLGTRCGLSKEPAWVFDATDLLGQFGTSVASAGDVNG